MGVTRAGVTVEVAVGEPVSGCEEHEGPTARAFMGRGQGGGSEGTL